MKQNRKTTIVIPNYNGIKYLDACLSSIYMDESEAKVILVDNASTDGGLEIVKKYPNVEIIECLENKGFSAAVNLGIQSAKTPFVLLLNNDTEVEKGFLKAMEKALEKHENAFSVSAQMRSLTQKEVLDNTGDYYCALGWAYGYGKGHLVKKEKECERTIFSSCAGAALYRRELFLKTGYFDELHFAYLEDVDIGYRARILGYSNWYAPQAVVYHAGSATSGSKYNLFKVKLSARNNIYIIEKNMPLFQIFINIPFFLIGFFIKFLFFLKKGMGKEYLRGLFSGFHLYFSGGGKEKHVSFQCCNIGHYLRIQLELWVNILRKIWA